MANRRPRKKPRVNRKRLQTQGFAVPPKVVALVTLIVVLSLGYVALRNSTEAHGRRIKLLEIEKAKKIEERIAEYSAWTEQIAPQRLKLALRKWNLDMGWPGDGRTVTIGQVDRVLGRIPESPGPVEVAEAPTGTFPR